MAEPDVQKLNGNFYGIDLNYCYCAYYVQLQIDEILVSRTNFVSLDFVLYSTLYRRLQSTSVYFRHSRVSYIWRVTINLRNVGLRRKSENIFVNNIRDC